jgi:YggT family protein
LGPVAIDLAFPVTMLCCFVLLSITGVLMRLA